MEYIVLFMLPTMKLSVLPPSKCGSEASLTISRGSVLRTDVLGSGQWREH